MKSLFEEVVERPCDKELEVCNFVDVVEVVVTVVIEVEVEVTSENNVNIASDVDIRNTVG